MPGPAHPDAPERAVDRHPHLADPVRPGHVRVDCHLHTAYSGDAVTTIDELADRVEETGLDVVCVTDHHSVRGALEAVEREIGCRIVVGEEIRTRAGEVIGLFLRERIPHGLDPWDVAARIRDQGGIVYVPHPFDPLRRCLDEGVLRSMCAEGVVDALEGFNAKAGLDHMNERAARLAREFDLPAGAGSDAHDPDAVGAAYAVMPDFDGPSDFVARLHDARPAGHRFDRPRRFVPRIIPGGLE